MSYIHLFSSDAFYDSGYFNFFLRISGVTRWHQICCYHWRNHRSQSQELGPITPKVVEEMSRDGLRRRHFVPCATVKSLWGNSSFKPMIESCSLSVIYCGHFEELVFRLASTKRERRRKEKCWAWGRLCWEMKTQKHITGSQSTE